MDKTTKSDGTATDTNTPPTAPDASLPGGLTKRDAADLAWFFYEAEGEIAPCPMFTLFDRTLHGVVCSIGGTAAACEPSDVQVAAAGRARRINQILDAAGREPTRVLQRWCAPPRYFTKDVQRELGRLAGVALRSSWCGSMEDLSELCAGASRSGGGDDAKVRRHAARARLTPLKLDAARMLEEAARGYVTARQAHDATPRTARSTPAQRALFALKKAR